MAEYCMTVDRGSWARGGGCCQQVALCAVGVSRCSCATY